MKNPFEGTQIQNLIGGKLLPATEGSTLPCHEPATGRTYATVPDSGSKDALAAIAAAHAAAPGWARTPESERAALLRKLARLIDRDLERLALAESIDNGKPLSLSSGLDIPRAAANFDFFSDAIAQWGSEFHPARQSSTRVQLNYTLRQPLGVVTCISPWNLPLYLFTWKIAPALAAGNCVIAKPSEVTPLTAYLLSELTIEAGLPPGVLNIVHGTGARVGEALCTDSRIAAISFTGSTRTGREIARQAALNFKKVSLEMGGKNALIVCADADIDLAVETAARAAFLNQGQICLCGSRILVARGIYDAFKARLLERVARMRLIDPLESKAKGPTPDEQGAVVSEAHFKKILSAIETARKEGGKILCGGKAASLGGRLAQGWYIEPTLIEGLPSDCSTEQEEIFGPVATLSAFNNDADAMARANSTRYGLTTTILTQDLSRAHRLAAQARSGIVWINCWMRRDLRTPFGGVGESGMGREGGADALRFFTEPKNVCIEYEEAP